MADRPKARGTRGDLIGNIRPINIDQGRSSAWARVADDAFRVSMLVADQLDTDARLDGWRKGFSGDLSSPLMFAPTIRGQAFTQQAIKSYFTNLEAQSRITVDELAAKHANDPGGLSAAVGEYIAQSTAALPAEFRGQAQAFLETTSLPYIAQARKNLVGLRQAQAEASGQLAERSAILEIDRFSRGLFSADAQVAESSQQGLEAVRARLGAMYSSTVEDERGNRHPVFSPGDRAKAIVSLEERIAKGTILGWFEEQPNKLQALRAMSEGRVVAPIVENGKVVGQYSPLAQLTAEDGMALIGKARSLFSAELSIQSSLQSMSDRAERRADEARLIDFYQSTNNSDPPAAIRAAQQVLATTSNPSTALAMRKFIDSGGAVDNPNNTGPYLVGKLAALEGKFDPTDPLSTYGLTAIQVAELAGVQSSAANRQRGESPANTARYRMARDLVSGWLANTTFDAGVAATAMGRDDPEFAKAVGYTVRLLEAVIADPSIDPVAWAFENVKPVTAGAGQVLRELTTELRQAQRDRRTRGDDLRRQGARMPYQDSDPDYAELNNRVQEISRRIEEVQSQGVAP